MHQDFFSDLLCCTMLDTVRERKMLLIASSLMNTLLFSGIIFGWAPLNVRKPPHDFCKTTPCVGSLASS
jgi:hypothetical protein